MNEASKLFILSTGVWIGEGTVSFSASPEVLRFFTKWTCDDKNAPREVCATQQVEMRGVEEQVVNRFRFFNFKPGGFAVELQNDLVGVTTGNGVVTDNEVGWEFRGHPNFEGFEIYRLQSNGDYSIHAEFSSDPFRTIIQGRLWRKMSA